MQPTQNSSFEQNSPDGRSSVVEKVNCNDVSNGNSSEIKTENDNTKATLEFSGSSPEHVKNEETGKEKLLRWINKQMKIEMTDGRVLIGIFLCTDRDGNVILGSCSEYLTEVCGFFDEPRLLGLVMVPGRHIVSIYHAPNNIEGETA